MESRFRYQVTPFSPIKDLIPGQSLRRAFTSDLTKDEVLLCMKHGPVCRLFPGKLPIRVTGSNIDSLHKKDFESDFVDVTPKDTVNTEKIEIGQPDVSEELKTGVPTTQNLDENNVGTENNENSTITDKEKTPDVVDEQEVVDKEPQVVEEQIEESTPAEDLTEAHEDSSVDVAKESQEIAAEAEEDEDGETLSVEEEGEESNPSTPVSANNYQQNGSKKKKRH